MYRKALAAFDRDDEVGSELIARRCADLADHHMCQISMINVRLPLPDSYTVHLPRQWEMGQRSETMDWLRQIAEDHRFADSVVELLAPAGSVADEVITAAQNAQSDVIIVAAHRMNLSRLILGSNTHAIVRDASCDTIVARNPAK